MGKSDVHTNAVWRNAAPAISKMPQHDQKAIIDPPQAADGEVKCQPMGSLHEAPRDRCRYLRPRLYVGEELPVQAGQANWLNHVPVDLTHHRMVRSDPKPRLENITWSEKLDAGVIGHRHLAGQQPIDQQEPQVGDVVEIIRLYRPATRGIAHHICQHAFASDRELLRGQIFAQLRICFKQGDHAGRLSCRDPGARHL